MEDNHAKETVVVPKTLEEQVREDKEARKKAVEAILVETCKQYNVAILPVVTLVGTQAEASLLVVPK